MKKTLLSFLFVACAGIAGLSALTTVKPEEVPVMNPLYLTRLVFRPIDDSRGYIDMAYDIDNDGIEDARFIYGYVVKEANMMDVGLIVYGFDENNNGIFEESELREIDYLSGELSEPQEGSQTPAVPQSQQAPQLPDYHKLWNEYFDIKEGPRVGV